MNKILGPRSRSAFTLIELMLVVIIIGVLATMVVPRLTGRSKQAKMTVAKSDINGGLATALDLFELDNGRYPKTENFPNALLETPNDLKDTWAGPYLKKAPKDPWGNAYQYKKDNSLSIGYRLWTITPDDEEINNLDEED